jgi:hypothetical protein
VYWDLPDQGWKDVARRIDPFLASAIRAIAAEYAADPVQWLVINHWADSGRLLVYPAQDGPNGDRGERIFFDFNSDYLENRHSYITEALTGLELQRAWKELAGVVWWRVSDCLRHGKASRQLAEARKVHRLRLAAFDYGFGEGLFYLTELDEEAAAEMQKELARSRRRYEEVKRGHREEKGEEKGGKEKGGHRE